MSWDSVYQTHTGPLVCLHNYTQCPTQGHALQGKHYPGVKNMSLFIFHLHWVFFLVTQETFVCALTQTICITCLEDAVL